MSLGLLEQALNDGRALVVPMGHVQFLAFHQQSKNAIGANQLTGCSVVMITSQFGAILAHIPPRPVHSDYNDPHAGDRNVEVMMGWVQALYNQRRNYFPTGSDTWAVFAVFEGTIGLPDQKRIVEARLTSMGLQPIQLDYYVVNPNTPAHLGRGTVFVDGGNHGEKPAVYSFIAIRLYH